MALNLEILRDNITRKMDEQGLTQAELAIRTGIPNSTISRYLNNVHDPKIDNIITIAKCLNTSLDYLCGLRESDRLDDTATPENSALYRAYNRADLHTQKMVVFQLENYLSSEERTVLETALNKTSSEKEPKPEMA